MITSIFDDDLYKFTMQQAVLALYPDAIATYIFINRGTHRFTPEFLTVLRHEVAEMKSLRAKTHELDKFGKMSFVKPWYKHFIHGYKYNPDEVKMNLNSDNNLEITIEGPWWSTIMWEVKLMAKISELYFQIIDKDWNMIDQDTKIKGKGAALAAHTYADFGTRRRRGYDTQNLVVKSLAGMPGFVGTSNVHLAIQYGVKAIGTMAHEWIQAHSVLMGLRHANRFALDAWAKVYRGNLGIALPDTFGTDAFIDDFDMYLAKLFDGVRHDSGDPIIFVDKIITHYKKLNIDPLSKTIVFSDGLDIGLALRIAEYCKGKIRISFGIGTNFTNDFGPSKALNMVIKLRKINGIDVVKLSDIETKAIGDTDAVKVANWTFFNKPLREQT